jgi:hypothetical protein
MEERHTTQEWPVQRNAEGCDDLKDRERNRDPEQAAPENPLAEAFRKAVLRVHGLGRRLHLGDFRRVHTLTH